MAQGFKTGGRQKGTPNKMTAQIRDALCQAFEESGGVEYLKKVATNHPSVFCTLLGKLLPTALTGEDGGPIALTGLTVTFVRPDQSGD